MYLPAMPRDDSPGPPPFEVRPSPMQGLGAFATRCIPAGTRLVEYTGERLTPAEADARYPDVPGERHHTYLFAIDDDVVIDAAYEANEARFINHSCAPNCDAVVHGGRIWIEAPDGGGTRFVLELPAVTAPPQPCSRAR